MNIKLLLFLPLLALLINCRNRQPEVAHTSTEIRVATFQNKVDLSIIDTAISMYNEPYRLRIEPHVDGDTFIASISLTKRTDTIFQKIMRMDSMHPISGLPSDTVANQKINIGTFQKDYLLKKIEYDFVRNYNLYFIATTESKLDQTKVYVEFIINYVDRPGFSPFFSVRSIDRRELFKKLSNKYENPQDSLTLVP